MIKKFNRRVRDAVSHNLLKASVMAVAALPVLASAQTADAAEQAITDAQTKILAYVAKGGAAMVAIVLAAIGFGVAVKWMKRGAGKS